ncbi:MAG: hypothetical protein FWF57_02955 [Defluviitaleaceae bacterium]|nr:hypothetical protein [Defluviitaleaceae bacterium]
MKKTFYSISVLFFFIILVSYFRNLVHFGETSIQNNNELGHFGYALGVSNRNSIELGPLLFMDTDENEILVYFSNEGGTDAEFVLKLFLDYRSIYFSVLNSYEHIYNKSYSFFLQDGESITIPISVLDSFDNFNYYAKLNTIIMIEPNLFQKNVQHFNDKFYGMSISSYVVFSPDEQLKEKVLDGYVNIADVSWSTNLNENLFEILPTIYPKNHFDFNIGTSIENIVPTFNPSYLSYITVQPKEKVNFYYVLGDTTIDGLNRFVIIGLLDWEQINLNNKEFLKVELPRNGYNNSLYAGFGNLIFEAPEETGMYEFIALAIGISDDIAFFTNIENSFRVTIVVE